MIRTRRIPFFASRPSVPLLLAAFGVVAIGAVLPGTPTAAALGFHPQPAGRRPVEAGSEPAPPHRRRAARCSTSSLPGRPAGEAVGAAQWQRVEGAVVFVLTVVLLAGLAGPLLATPPRWRLPIVVGEILLGVVVGRTGTGWIHPEDPILTFLATMGFALVMLVAGSHVPLRNAALRVALRRGALLAGLVGALAVPAGLGVAALVGTGHGLVYAVLFAASSAALVMPVLDELDQATPAGLATIVHVAIADTVCIIVLPLAEAPTRAGTAALGVLAVIAAGGAWYLVMRRLRSRGVIARVHRLSKARHFGLELRIELIGLFGLAGLAELLGVSVMLAGFVCGLALAAQGEPRRLARQLFAVADGFLGPVFFVWLGASLDLRELGVRPLMLVLAGLLAVGAVVVHAAARLVGQPLSLALLAGAQLGVPVSAVTIGADQHLLAPGEGGAILAAALVSVGVTAWAARAIPRPGPR